MDLFRKMFMEGYSASSITVATVIACTLCTLVIAVYIYGVYRLISKNAFYNKSFNLSIIIIALITSAIILTIQSNIVVSLGMVGALSIVRFRTAIKDPMDLAFLFWSISVGIICGAGFAAIAVVVSLVITTVIVVFSRMRFTNDDKLLVIDADSYQAEKEILEFVRSKAGYVKVRARNVSKRGINLAVEVSKCDEEGLIGGLIEMDAVTNASLVEHDGNITL